MISVISVIGGRVISVISVVGGFEISVTSVVRGWDFMVTDVTAPIYGWCIVGDISTFSVGDATATMTPDGKAF